jgi:hypothetical protein
MMIRAVILWLHVVCGVVWISACATFVFAAAALTGEPDEAYAFALRVVPQINRLCSPLAVVIPITGIGNLFFAARARGSALPAEFIGILAAKVALFAIMALGFFGARRAALKFQELSPMGVHKSPYPVSFRLIMAWYGTIVAAGIVALGLGLWLSGT